MISKIKRSIEKFHLDLSHKVVLTEAATGVYAVTPIIAALAGAKVYALAKETSYGSYEDIERDIDSLSKQLDIPRHMLTIVKTIEEVDDAIDIVTNSGFVRPINAALIDKLSSGSVISLMYEPWEFREEDIDIAAATEKGLKIYGTNEHDPRLRTMEYIGYVVLYHLLNQKITHFSGRKIIVMGTPEFTDPICRVLEENHYRYSCINRYERKVDVADTDILVIAENKTPEFIIGGKDAFIDKNLLTFRNMIIHISGNVDVTGLPSVCIPEKPCPFGYMSFRTDFADEMALIDLQTASLSVGEGMLKANAFHLKDEEYRNFMESNYPALWFDETKYLKQDKI